jgi:hypothetical protein
MRKFFVILFIMAFMPCVFADEDDGSLWDNYGDQNFYGTQKYVSDKDFEKAVESKTRKKKKDKNIPKGDMYRESNETDAIINTKIELPILSVPMDLYINESALPVGHYQIKGEKLDGKPVLKLYQAHYLIAQLPAVETKDDFGQKELNFVKLIDYNDHAIKIIFGNLDFNAYAIVETKSEQH